MDTLYIDQLAIMARIGVYDWEKQCLQKLIFDLQLVYTRQFCINKTNTSFYIDYTQINQIIINIVNTKHFLLIEEIAEIVSETLIKKFPIISQVRIRVNKPGAVHNARNVGIFMQRNQSNNSKNFKLYTGWR